MFTAAAAAWKELGALLRVLTTRLARKGVLLRVRCVMSSRGASARRC